MHFMKNLSRSLLLVGTVLVAPVLGQNTTNSPAEPGGPEPTLAPSGEFNSTIPPDVNSTVETPPPSSSLSPEMNATSPPSVTIEKPPCYDNTTLLREHLMEKNAFTPEIYELCSNTVFEIGEVSDPGQLCCLDGQSPLHPRSNSKIQCGPDGSPDNNCTLVGGSFQVLNVYTVFFEQPENAVIEGITFRGATMSAALLVNGGSLTFRNCTFEEHVNDGVVVSFHSGPSLNPSSRKLMDSMAGLSLEERVTWNVVEYSKLLRGEESAVDASSVFGTSDSLDYHNEERQNDRELQAGVVWELQEYFFENCVFQNNQQGDVGDSTKYGVVSVELAYDVGTFENCTFYNNSYGDSDEGRGYALSFATGSKLNLINNCFIDNNFIGEGTVLVGSANDIEESSGNYGTTDDLIACQFVHVDNGDKYECIEYEATKCFSRPNDEPSLGPVPKASVPVPTTLGSVSMASGSGSRAPVFALLSILVALLSFL